MSSVAPSSVEVGQSFRLAVASRMDPAGIRRSEEGE